MASSTVRAGGAGGLGGTNRKPQGGGQPAEVSCNGTPMAGSIHRREITVRATVWGVLSRLAAMAACILIPTMLSSCAEGDRIRVTGKQCSEA